MAAISALGRAAIAEMNRLGMLVDVAHVSREAMLQAAECSRTPVVATHSCIRALCDNPRNLDDAQLDALRDVGGVVQVTAVLGVPATECQARRGDGRRISPITSTMRCAGSASSMSASRRISTAAAGSPAGRMPRKARTSRPNCCGAAMTGQRCRAMGRQFPARAADLRRRRQHDPHRSPAGWHRRSGAGPGHLAHGRARQRGEGRGGGAAAGHRTRHDADRHRGDVRQRRRRGGRRRGHRRAARQDVHGQQGLSAQRLAYRRAGGVRAQPETAEHRSASICICCTGAAAIRLPRRSRRSRS